MKLLQWNIQWCRGVDGCVDASRIARVARQLADPDVVCFQEVAVNFPALAGSSGEDQVALLSNEFPGYTAVFGCAVDVPDGAGARRRFGNLVLTRYPVQQVWRHTLPWPAEDDTPSMPRIAVEAVVEAPFGPLRVTTTHLEYYALGQRAAQVERLRELHAEACGHARARPAARYESGPFEHFPRPASAILSADFNLQVDDPSYARLQARFDDGTPRLVDVWTHMHPATPHPPSFCVYDRQYGEKPYCCDFVFVTADLLTRVSSVHIDAHTQASDHQPVIIELDD